MPHFSVSLRPFEGAGEGASCIVLTALSAAGDWMDLCESFPLLVPAGPVMFSLLGVQATVDLCIVCPPRGRLLTPGSVSPIWKLLASVDDSDGVFAERRREMEASLWPG